MKENRKRVQAYVSLSTYESLKSEAESRGISLSELVSETLQTELVSGGYSEAFVDGEGYVTKEQLRRVLGEFKCEIEREIIREVNKAELQWEANASALVAMNSSVAEFMTSSGKLENRK